MFSVFSSIFELLFPSYCLSCHNEFDSFLNHSEFVSPWICKRCFSKIRLHDALHCPYCGSRYVYAGKTHARCRTHSGLNGMLAALSYTDPFARIAIAHLKYFGIRDLAAPLAALILRYLKKMGFSCCGYVIVPVPIPSHRKRSRGYNQAEELACQLGMQLRIPVLNGVIKRTRETPPQTQFPSDRDRAFNVQNAFSCINAAAVYKKKILLVDDVVTSGATMRECAKALRNAKPTSVWGVAIAGRR